MFQIPLMVSALRKQRNLLEELLNRMEEKESLNAEDCHFYDTQTERVASNLGKLREIKKDYCKYLNESSCVCN